MKFIIKHVSIIKNSKTITYFVEWIYIWGGGGVTIMAIICHRVVILLRFCADMIDKTLTYHLIPNLSHLEHMEHCYKVINAKAKFWPRGNLEFAFLGVHGGPLWPTA